MSGFSFAGLHCERDMHIKYAPTAAERAGFFAKFNVQDADFDTKDGGIYYNTTLKAQEMELPCFYEEITRTERERIIRWLEHGRRGRLIFDDRPYCYYDVIPKAEMNIREYPVSTRDGIRYLRITSCTITVTYQDATVWYNHGGTWRQCSVWYRSGSSWIQCVPWYRNGSTWVRV